jgi:hypothetical protein
MKTVLLGVALGLVSNVAFADKPNASCDLKLGQETYKGNCIVRYNTHEKSWMVFEPNDNQLFDEIHVLDLQVTGKNTRNARTMVGDEIIEFGKISKTSPDCFSGKKLRVCYKMK